jgi:hypothetical protein
VVDMEHDVTSPYFQWWVLSTALTRFNSIRIPLGTIPKLGRNTSFWIQILDNGFPATEKTIIISSDMKDAFDIWRIGVATFALVTSIIMVWMCTIFIDMGMKMRRRISDERTSSLTLSMYGRSSEPLPV